MSRDRGERRELKSRVIELLALPDAQAARERMRLLPERAMVRALLSELPSPDPVVKGRAAAALGEAVAKLSERDLEAGRDIMRRLIWNLNDESGNCAQGSPEAMAEIMARHGVLAREFAKILISFVTPEGLYLDYGPLRRGAVWAIGRLAQVEPKLVRDAAPRLAELTGADDPALRGLSAWALGLLGDPSFGPRLETLLADRAELTIQRDWGLEAASVGELAREALTRLGGSDACPAAGGGGVR